MKLIRGMLSMFFFIVGLFGLLAAAFAVVAAVASTTQQQPTPPPTTIVAATIPGLLASAVAIALLWCSRWLDGKTGPVRRYRPGSSLDLER